MSTVVTLQLNSTSSEVTERLAEKIGRVLHGDETIVLVGDLGSGKTTFSRGLARGAGSSDVVGSPTFTISKMYSAARFQIHHFDFYRLTESGILADELTEVIHDPQSVAVIEWPDAVRQVLPEQRLTVQFQLLPDGSRALTFTSSEQLAYLTKMLP